jgi:hypothetical protein
MTCPNDTQKDDTNQPKKRRRLRTGEERKQAQLANHEARNWKEIRRGRRALLMALRGGKETATIEDVHAVVELSPDRSRSLLGSVPGLLARAGIIAPAGFVKTTRRVAHARHIQAWKLVNHALADQWLAANPDVPDDAHEGERGAA